MHIRSLKDIPPVEYGGLPPELAEAMSHRKVLSAMSGGPQNIDLDYNTFKAGVGATEAVAYTKDEVCYTAAGAFEGFDRGVPIVIRTGQFMWRPAGAVSDGGVVTEDAVTICAFGPAREDDWGHRLSPEGWDGDVATRSIPVRRHFSEVEPTPFPGAHEGAQISHRVIFSRKDGSEYLNVAHTAFAEGVTLENITSDRDEVWWLETGGLAILADGANLRMERSDFLYRAAGETIEKLTVDSNSIVICWSAVPAS